MTTKNYDYYVNQNSEPAENSYQKIKNLAKKGKPVKEFIGGEKSNKYGFFKDDNNTFQLNLKNFENYKNLITNQNHDIQNLPYGSFYLNVGIKLKSPYYSGDDDFFYPIDNPVRKEKVIKKPYIAGGQWKGFMLSAAKKLVQEDFDPNEGNYNNGFQKILQIWRIFGSGNDEFLTFLDSFEYEDYNGKFKKITKIKDFDKKFKEYLMFEMGVMVDFEKENIEGDINKHNSKIKEHDSLFESRRGRLVLLPSFFDKIGLEVINELDKNTRTSKRGPIHFETIAKGQESKLKMYYIPFDLVGQKSNDKIKGEVEEDIQFLGKIMEKLKELGIGAKNKYGWGSFVFCENDNNKFYTSPNDLEITNLLENLQKESCKDKEKLTNYSIKKKKK